MNQQKRNLLNGENTNCLAIYNSHILFVHILHGFAYISLIL